MIELFFFLFIFSGLIKSYLYTFKIELPLDFTIATGACLLLVTAIKLFQAKDLALFKKLSSWKGKKPLLWFGAFVIWMLLTISYTSSDQFAFKKAYLFGTNILAFGVPAFFRGFNFRLFSRISVAMTMVLGILFFALHPISLYLHQRDFNMLDLEAFEGVYMALAVLISITLVLLTTLKYRHYHAVIYTALFYLMIYSGARGAILGFALLLLILGMRHRVKIKDFLNALKSAQKKSWKKVVTFLALCGIVSSLFFYAVSTNKYCGYVVYRSFARLGLAMDSLLETESDDSIVSVFKNKPNEQQSAVEEMEEANNTSRNRSIVARAIHFKFSYKMITSSVKALVLGYGLGSYGIEFMDEDRRAYPHNLILEIWFELGLVGLILFMLFLFSSYIEFKDVSLYLLLIVVFLFLQALKSGSLVDHRLLFGFIALGFTSLNDRANA